jgi:acyl-coenzyme A thioesterase PaaI-like protein
MAAPATPASRAANPAGMDRVPAVTDFDAIAAGMTQAVPFAGYLDLEITEVAEGESTVVLPERDELKNHVGSQHAGALFTVAEAASGAAFVGAFAERMGDVTPLARNAEIAYEKIAKGPITAQATLGMPRDEALSTLDRDGKVEFPCEVVLSDSDGTQVATATVRWHVRLNNPATA